MTDAEKEALNAVKTIKEYCNNRYDCETCIFHEKSSVGEYWCSLKRELPYEWVCDKENEEG